MTESPEPTPNVRGLPAPGRITANGSDGEPFGVGDRVTFAEQVAYEGRTVEPGTRGLVERIEAHDDRPLVTVALDDDARLVTCPARLLTLLLVPDDEVSLTAD